MVFMQQVKKFQGGGGEGHAPKFCKVFYLHIKFDRSKSKSVDSEQKHSTCTRVCTYIIINDPSEITLTEDSVANTNITVYMSIYSFYLWA